MGVLIEDGTQVPEPDFDKAISDLDAEQYGPGGIEDAVRPAVVEDATQDTVLPEGGETGKSSDAKGAEKANAGAQEAEDGEEREAGKIVETPTPAAFIIPDELKELVPETVKDPASLAIYIKDINEKYTAESKANEEFVDMLSANPMLLDVMQDMKKNGTSLFEAAAKVMQMGEGESIPEAGTPEYKEFVRKQIALEEARKRMAAEEEATQKLMVEAETHAKSMTRAFREANADITDDRWSDFQRFVRGITQGDPKTGRLPNNAIAVWWKAYTYDEKMKQAEESAQKAREKGRIDGKNEAIESTVKTRKPTAGDGLPHFQGGSKQTPVKDGLTDLETDLAPRRIFEP